MPFIHVKTGLYLRACVSDYPVVFELLVHTLIFSCHAGSKQYSWEEDFRSDERHGRCKCLKSPFCIFRRKNLYTFDITKTTTQNLKKQAMMNLPDNLAHIFAYNKYSICLELKHKKVQKVDIQHPTLISTANWFPCNYTTSLLSKFSSSSSSRGTTSVCLGSEEVKRTTRQHESALVLRQRVLSRHADLTAILLLDNDGDGALATAVEDIE